jgi:hypothetical protein
MLLAAPVGSILALAMIFIFGHAVDGTLICSEFLANGIDKNVCEGFIGYGNISLITAIQRFLNNFNFEFIKIIILAIGIIIIPNLLYLSSTQNSNYKKNDFLIINIILIIISFPLFIMAIDWGRWVSMHITMSVISLTVFLETKRNHNSVIYKKFSLNKNNIYLFMALLIFILSTFLYSIQHCCENDFIILFGPIIKIATTLGLLK